MAKIIVFTVDYCPYCKKAKDLLTAKGMEYEEIDITNDPDKRADLVNQTGKTTVPQIFIDGKSIGGYTDLERLYLSGSLSLLTGEEQPENWGKDF